MPTALPNLYCTVTDLFDALGSEGVDLRQDDHNLATGQTITLTAPALAGAVSLSVSALQFGILAGDTLRFDGGGAPDVVTVVLGAPAALGATSLTILPLAADLPTSAAAFDSGVNVALAKRAVKACQYATSQVRDYCLGRYNDSQLVTSFSVNRWATALAARWLCRRRGQSAPDGINETAEEALEELRQVSVGMIKIGGLGTRTAGWPFISNVTVDPRFDTARVRVETSISEQTPTQYAQYVDWNSVWAIEAF